MFETTHVSESKAKILDHLVRKGLKYHSLDFDSGCCMIDFWKAGKMYVVQIEHDSIGISVLANTDVLGDFGTIPDRRFFDFEEFSIALKKITG